RAPRAPRGRGRAHGIPRRPDPAPTVPHARGGGVLCSGARGSADPPRHESSSGPAVLPPRPRRGDHSHHPGPTARLGLCGERGAAHGRASRAVLLSELCRPDLRRAVRDRKSTRLNSSHGSISYAVFCFAAYLHLHSFPTRRSSDLQGMSRVAGRRSFRLAHAAATIRIIRGPPLDWGFVVSVAQHMGVLPGLCCYLSYVDQIYGALYEIGRAHV